MPARVRIAAGALLAIHALLAVHTAYRKSVTVDEVGHLPAGISYWEQGTFELYHHNPPLVKLLAALPALASNPTVDYTKSWEKNRQAGMPLSPWAFGWEFMYANAARYQNIFFAARLPVVGLSLLAGLVIFLWASELFGPTSGLIGLALWTFCPNAIAHAGLVTTDMGATSIGFVATYLFWRYLCRPTWPRAGVAGVLLGLAQLAKFSSLLLYGIWPAVWLVWLVGQSRKGWLGSGLRASSTQGRDEPQGARRLDPRHPVSRSRHPILLSGCQFLVILLLSIVVINLGYFFEGTGTRLKQFTFLSKSLTRPRPANSPLPAVSTQHPWYRVIVERENRFAGTWLAAVPVPLPRHYVEGFDEQKLESEGVDGQGYPVYLLGELRRTGWWWYFVFALAVKVPLGTWVLMLLVIGGLVRRKLPWGSRVDELVLLLPIVTVLVVMSFFTDINLGLRYVLPIFPFWYVRVSRVACSLRPVERNTLTRSVGEGDSPPGHRSRFGFVSAAVLAALAWNAIACVRTHPDHLAYFNELVGGPKNGSRCLIDSNLDWGQDLLTLQRWLAEHRSGQRVGLAYFGNVDPSILAASGRAIDFELAPPGRLESLRLVASKPESPLFEDRNRWISEHYSELQAWMAEQHGSGRPMQLNDHPALRSLAFDRIGLHEGPQPGLFAISANLVVGLPFRVRDQAGSIWSAEQDAFGYFRKLTPIKKVGYSIFVYEVTAEQANALRAELGLKPINQQ